MWTCPLCQQQLSRGSADLVTGVCTKCAASALERQTREDPDAARRARRLKVLLAIAGFIIGYPTLFIVERIVAGRMLFGLGCDEACAVFGAMFGWSIGGAIESRRATRRLVGAQKHEP